VIGSRGVTVFRTCDAHVRLLPATPCDLIHAHRSGARDESLSLARDRLEAFSRTSCAAHRSVRD